MGRLIAGDLCNAAEFSRDRANLDLHPAVDHAVLLAAIERCARQTFRNIFDAAEEGPHLIDRMSDHEAPPELDLRLPVGFDPRGCPRRADTWGGPNASGGKGRCPPPPHAPGAPRPGRPLSPPAPPGDGFPPARPPVGKDTL